MVHIPKIQSTKNYDCFQFNSWNRKVSQSHVDMLANDPTFPEKYPTAPTVVDSNFNIIDGQHRCRAAQKLNIPVYFIVDPTATQDDVRVRNMQSRAWKGKNFVNYYSEMGKKSYKIMEEIIEKHQIPLTYLNAIIVKMCDYKQIGYVYIFKRGDLNIEKYENMLKDFCDLCFPVLKLCRTIKGDKITTPLFTQSYLFGFAHYYMNDRDFFKKVLQKLPKCGIDFTHAQSYESGREAILKIGNWSPPKIEQIKQSKKKS